MSSPVHSTMADELRHAAETGNIDTLYSILHRDPNILKTMDETAQLAETPLHVAASSNANEETICRVEFAIEVAILMPSFARKLNLDGQTPLHLALLHQNFKTARALIRIDAQLIRVKGKGSKTPLHVTAEEGMPKIFHDFLLACPSSVEDLTVRRETVAHLAAREGNLVTYQVLLYFLITSNKDVKNFMNQNNFEGDTALHIATRENKPQMVRKLVKYVDRDAKNFNGRTALDICREAPQPQQDITLLIETILRAPKQKCGMLGSAIKFLTVTNRPREKLSEDNSRDLTAILVVAVLVASTTYQGILTPSGFWNSMINNGTLADPSPSCGSTSHYAGQQIMTARDQDEYLYSNTIAFLMSIALIIAMMPSTISKLALVYLIPLITTYEKAIKYSVTRTSNLDNIVEAFKLGLIVYANIITFQRLVADRFQIEKKKKMLLLIDQSGEIEPHRPAPDLQNP